MEPRIRQAVRVGLGSVLVLMGVIAFGSCAGEGSTPAASVISGHDNPLLAEWHTPFGVPPFDLIRNEHYLPAMREAMVEHKAEIAAIVGQPDAPTFANTLESLERAGALYTRVSSVFNAVNGANTNDTLQEVDRILAPEQAAHADAISMNPALYQRIRAVYDQRDQLTLTPEQRRFLEETHKEFVRKAGLDTTRFDRCLESGSRREMIEQDMAEAALSGITGTPGVVINGYWISGSPSLTYLEEVLADIEKGKAPRVGRSAGKWMRTAGAAYMINVEPLRARTGAVAMSAGKDARKAPYREEVTT